MTGKGVIFDLVAVQSPSYRGRGIARYSFELARAIARKYPELVSAMVVHPELGEAEELAELEQWVTAGPEWDRGSVLHLSSVFEPELPVRAFWPPEATRHGLLTAVTLYDLIPDLFPGWYLQDPGLRRRWRCCREVVRAADLVLTISESTRQDAMALLGIPDERVTVIGTGTAPVFVPPPSRQAALEVAVAAVDGLEGGFIIFNGAFDPRKNVDRLVQGYAALPPHVVAHHQLLIVCSAPPLTRNHYLVMARELGVQGRVLIPGYLPDEVLVALNQSAELCVFPSLYEGYGFPVIEAMACGTPAIAGNNSSLSEILPREARFQPEDPGAIAEAVHRALYDPDHRARLVRLAERPPPSWDEVADRAAPALEDLLRQASRHPRAWRPRPHVALFGVPEQIREGLGDEVTYDLYDWPPGNPVALSLSGAWRGGYDAVVLAPGAGEPWMPASLAEVAAVVPGRCLLLTGPGTSAALLATAEELGVPVLGATDAANARAIVDLAQRSAG